MSVFIPGAVTEYSSINAFSASNKWLLLIAGGRKDHFNLYDAASGSLVERLPLAARSDPRWDLHDPNFLYFHDPDGNRLLSLNVSTGIVKTLRTFGGAITFGGGEGDNEGQRLPIVEGRYVSVYDIDTNTDSSKLDTEGHPFDSVYLAPGSGLVISWNENGIGRFQGIELWDERIGFVRQLTNAGGHHDICRLAPHDVSGPSAMIWTSSAEKPDTMEDPDTKISACPNGIRLVNLADAKQKCLLSLGWNIAVHVSCPDNAGWALVECYQAPDAPVAEYSGELLRVWFDGRVDRLGPHGSVLADEHDYVNQPKATVSRDGFLLAWTSNASGALGTYLMRLDAPDIPEPPPVPLPPSIEQRLAKLEADVEQLKQGAHDTTGARSTRRL